jgi:hypothetical protein
VQLPRNPCVSSIAPSWRWWRRRPEIAAVGVVAARVKVAIFDARRRAGRVDAALVPLVLVVVLVPVPVAQAVGALVQGGLVAVVLERTLQSIGFGLFRVP